MTATIHPLPRARKTTGLGYPAAFGSAAGPGFQWGTPVQPARPSAALPLAERIAHVEAGLGRTARGGGRR
ncbi:hypothetical protein [Aureimonas sp. SK2]|uniref:hypothetical protein n=1 Tax=Aureimonas sp. SK2 TaxID=3015992 RepID=UPI0024446B62|nr:hypothetical protein [Aureimonas sp. SK2]